MDGGQRLCSGSCWQRCKGYKRLLWSLSRTGSNAAPFENTQKEILTAKPPMGTTQPQPGALCLGTGDMVTFTSLENAQHRDPSSVGLGNALRERSLVHEAEPF